MNTRDELIDGLGPVVDAFDQLGVAWFVGGSVASGAFGEFRATNDVDVIADLQLRGPRGPAEASRDAQQGAREL